jgi:hypothetical protein
MYIDMGDVPCFSCFIGIVVGLGSWSLGEAASVTNGQWPSQSQSKQAHTDAEAAGGVFYVSQFEIGN